MTKRSGIFALMAALGIVLPFVGLLSTSPSGAAGSDTATTVAITGNPNPGTTGSITYDVTVAATDGGTPTGTVDVSDAAGGSCSIPDITGSCAISENAAGSPYTVTATYSGDDTYASAFGTVSETVTQATPTTPTISNLPTGATVGGNFTASIQTNGDGATSVASNSTSVCTVAGLVVSFIAGGTCSLTAQVAAGTNYVGATGTAQTFTVSGASPTQPTITNIPVGATYGLSFLASVQTSGDGATSVVSTTTGVCTVAAPLTVSFVGVGQCSLTAQVAAGTDYSGATGVAQPFQIAQATPTSPTISNIPTGATFGGNFTASVQTNGDGTTVVVSNTTSVCTVGAAQKVSFVAGGTCSLTAGVSAGIDYVGAIGTAQTFTVAQVQLPAAPTITNLPSSGTFNGGFTATLNGAYGSLSGIGTQSVATTTPAVCATNGLAVTYVGVGTCSLFAQVTQGNNYLSGSGASQSFTIGRANPTTPTITNIPSPANEFFGFSALVGTTGDGTPTVTSSTPKVCSVDSNGLTVTFVGFGTCTLTPSVAQGTNFFGATGSPQSFQVQEASHGYWLVGSDGGIFSFGTAAFHGSMGATPLQRPVVAITPTLTGNGYWLVASDGGIFSFGDSTYYGSLPALGFHPFASGVAQSLNAPIVGMVPTFTGRGYFMVASDGGVFAFGDAKFKGSCPGIGGCAGAAVAVMPDRTGNGYWLVTSLGDVYSFGDAPYYGGPTPTSVPVVDAVATPDGHGYWLLYANGVVDNFGDATNFGAPVGYVNGFNPATAIFPTADGQGYWVASGRGDVFTYGDSPYLGGEAAAGLNGEIIAAFGF